MGNRRSAAALLLCASLLTLAGPRPGAARLLGASRIAAVGGEPSVRVVIPEPSRVKPSPPPLSALRPPRHK